MLSKSFSNSYLNAPKQLGYHRHKFFFNIGQILDKKSLVESIRLLKTYKEGTNDPANTSVFDENTQTELIKNYNAVKPNIYWIHLIKFLSSKDNLPNGNCLLYFYTLDQNLKSLFIEMISSDSQLNKYPIFDNIQDAFVYDNGLDCNNVLDRFIIFDDEISTKKEELEPIKAWDNEIIVVQTASEGAEEGFTQEKVHDSIYQVKIKTLKDLNQLKTLNEDLLQEVNWPQEEYFIDF